jgi:putative transposase
MRAQNHEGKIVPNGWMRLADSEPEAVAASTLTIEVGGFHLAVNSETDMELLAKVCRMMKSL